MTFNVPEITTIRTRIIADIEAITGKPVGGDEDIVRIMATSFAGAVFEQYKYLEYVFNQSFVHLADDKHIGYHGLDYDIAIKQATMATLTIKFEGDTGVEILKDSVLQAGDVQFTLTQAGVIAAGGVLLEANANIAGALAQDYTGQALTLQSPIIGVPHMMVTHFINGTNAESTEEYQARILNFIRKTPLSGANHDYTRWALEVVGVKDVWVYPNEQGVGTVVLRFITYDGLPNADEVQQVQQYIDSKRPVTADVMVVAPTYKAINITIETTNNDASQQQKIEDGLRYLFDRKAIPGGAIYSSQIISTIGNSASIDDFTVITPTQTLQAQGNEILQMGSITWQ